MLESVSRSHITSNSADETQGFGYALGKHVQDGDAIALIGDLGAGKTNFVQGVACALGVEEAISSPTFNLVNAYDEASVLLYHFDLYRLEDAMELEDIDFYALSDNDTEGVSLIEWADRFAEELPEDRLEIHIAADENDINARSMTADAFGPRASQLLASWTDALQSAEERRECE